MEVVASALPDAACRPAGDTSSSCYRINTSCRNTSAPISAIIYWFLLFLSTAIVLEMLQDFSFDLHKMKLNVNISGRAGEVWCFWFLTRQTSGRMLDLLSKTLLQSSEPPKNPNVFCSHLYQSEKKLKKILIWRVKSKSTTKSLFYCFNISFIL